MRLDLKGNNIACVYEKNQPSGSEKCGTYTITGNELRFDIPGNQMYGGHILENGDISLLDWSEPGIYRHEKSLKNSQGLSRLYG